MDGNSIETFPAFIFSLFKISLSTFMGFYHIKKHKIFSDEKIKADIELTKQMPIFDEKSSSVMSRSTIRVLLYIITKI